MTTNENKKSSQSGNITIGDLMKRQSVRATFKLSQNVIDLLGVVAGQLRIKQKTLLDQLIEDNLALNHLAKSVNQKSVNRKPRRQKTFVLSRNTLESINTVAKKQNIPRDILVEVSIKRLVPLIQSELDKHRKRKVILDDLKAHLKAGEKVKNRAHELLGTDDDMYRMIEKQLALSTQNIIEIDALIKKGMPLENW